MDLKQIVKKMTNILPDALFLRLEYFRRLGCFPNLTNPKTFNEKLQWLKLHDRKPEYTRMVDKYEAKQYVAERIGEEYIIPTLGVWDRFEDIDFDKLPDQFVLKCTHDSGGLVICRDKAKLDIAAARKKINTCLKTNYYWHSREWPYKNVKPRIIAEVYIEDEPGTDLNDYKVICFDGKTKIIQVHKGRFQQHTQNFYDENWNALGIYQDCPLSEEEMECPTFLEQMLVLSGKLSQGIPVVRVDWYCVKGQLYFGELTFFDGAGFAAFEPEQWDYTFGSWIQLPRR